MKQKRKKKWVAMCMAVIVGTTAILGSIGMAKGAVVTSMQDEIDMDAMINGADPMVQVSFTGEGNTTNLDTVKQVLFDGAAGKDESGNNHFVDLRNGYYDYDAGQAVTGNKCGDVVFDFQDARISLSRVQLWARADLTSRIKDFQVFGSNDGQSWEAVTAKVDDTRTVDGITYGVEKANTATDTDLWSHNTDYFRYIRLINTNQNNYGSIGEAVFFGTVKEASQVREGEIAVKDLLDDGDAAVSVGTDRGAGLFDKNVATGLTLDQGETDCVLDFGECTAVISGFALLTNPLQPEALDGIVISGSNDGKTWTELSDAFTGASSQWAEQDSKDNSTEFRYIRLAGTDGWNGGIAEWKLYGEVRGLTEKVVLSLIDNAQGTILMDARHQDEDVINETHPERGWDGNVNTWPDLRRKGDDGKLYSDSGNGWMALQFDTPHKIARIDYYPRSGQETRMRGCYFQASVDGENWTELLQVQGIPKSGQYTRNDIYDNTEYSYIRYGCVEGTYMNVASIQLYEVAEVPEAALTRTMDNAKNEITEYREKSAALNDSAAPIITAVTGQLEDVINGASAESNPVSSYIEVKGLLRRLHFVDQYDSFQPGSLWLDTEGEMIQAHGGGVLYDEKTQKYYWYGEHKGTENYTNSAGVTAGTPVIGTSVYSSTDLYNWTNEGVALPVFNNPIWKSETAEITEDTPLYLNESTDEWKAYHQQASEQVSDYVDYTRYYTFEQYNKHDVDALNRLYDDLTVAEKKELYNNLNWDMVMERPKVVYNANTDKYVMYFHLDGKGVGKYNVSKPGVAVADSPTGPFRYLGPLDLSKGKENIVSVNGNTDMLRDMQLFVDDDNTAYLIHANEVNDTLYIEELTEDYTDITGRFSRNYIRSDFDKGTDAREAPAIMKYQGVYYLVSSGCTGWATNPAGVSSADKLIIDYAADDVSEDAVQHVGSFQHRYTEDGQPLLLLNPCVGPRYNSTFDGQSTYLLPVQGKDGEFLYMSDNWCANDLKRSRYTWLPVVIDDRTPTEYDGSETLSIPWTDSWSLGDMDAIASNRSTYNSWIMIFQNHIQCSSRGLLNFSDDVLTEMKAAVEEYAAVSLDADETQIAALIDRMEEINEAVEFDRVNLALRKAKALSEIEYTAASWSKVREAEEVLRSFRAGETTEEQIKAAEEQLQSAIEALVVIPYEETILDSETLSGQGSSDYSSTDSSDKALDGNSDTKWHSAASSGPCSAAEDKVYYTITLPQPLAEKTIMRLYYLPRQDNNSNGVILQYAVKYSNDGTAYTETENGYWSDDETEKTVSFAVPEGTQYIRLVAQASHDGTFASAAELKLSVLTGGDAAYARGDVNQNGSITTDDVLAALQIASGEKKETDTASRDLADMNGDGAVTAVDAMLILKLALK